MNKTTISKMIGLTFDNVLDSSDTLTFYQNGKVRFKFYHEQDCCENVRIEDICGDLTDLIGTPLLVAAEISGKAPEMKHDESFTWTFYKFSTVKGHVTVRWLGESNGYYGEGVDLFDSACQA